MLSIRKILIVLAIYAIFYYLKKLQTKTSSSNNSNINHTKQAFKDLNLLPNASFEEVKSQHKALSKQYHPDTNGNDEKNKKKMQKINAAYALLKKHFKQ